MSSYPIEYLEDLFNQRRYVQLMQHIAAAETDPTLRAMRANAQDYFDAGLNRIRNAYTEICGAEPSTSHQEEQLRERYDQEVGPICDQPLESEAYARALIAEAEDLANRSADRREILVRLYAAGTLPIESNTLIEELRQARTRLAASTDSVPHPNDKMRTIILPETKSRSRKRQSTSDSSKTHHQHPVPPVELTTEQLEPEPDHVLETLTQLAAELCQPDADLAAIKRRLDDLRPEAQLSHSALFNRLEQQYAAHQHQIVRLNQLLGQSLRHWMDTTSIPQTARDLLQEIIFIFDADSRLIQDLRQRYTHRVNEYKQTIKQIGTLTALDGPTLISELNRLEALFGHDYPQLHEHQQRRTAYEQEQERKQDAANREVRRKQYLDLRLAFDSALKSLSSNAGTFQDLRTQAQNASKDTLLKPEENPFDPETFAYYDLLYEDRLHRIEHPKLASAATAANDQEYLEAIGYAENLLISQGDDPWVRKQAEDRLNTYRQQLCQKAEGDVTRTIADAKKLLEIYDYTGALSELTSTKQNLEDINAALSGPKELTTTLTSLITQLEPVITEAEELQQRGEQADQLQQQARAVAPETSQTPDFPQAIRHLTEASNIADWRRATLDREIETLRERQNRFVTQCMVQSATARRMGNYDQAEEHLNQASRNAHTEEQHSQIAEERAAIQTQKSNTDLYETKREGLLNLLKEVRNGENIEQLPGRINAYRMEIGTQEAPRFDETRWIELNSLLCQAEEWIKAWQDYRALKTQAEIAAMNGNDTQFDEIRKQMSESSVHTFLPIQKDQGLLRKMVSIGHRAEIVRNLLEALQSKLASNESITVEDIDHPIRLSHGLDEYDDIVADVEFFRSLRPLYAARAELKGYIEDGRFAEVDPYIDTLPKDIQEDQVIQQYKREAKSQQAQQKFKKQLDQHSNTLWRIIPQAWDKLPEFKTCIRDLDAFANETDNHIRDTEPRLAAATIQQLEELANNLQASRRQFDQKEYDRARETLSIISTNLSSLDHRLACYGEELKQLKIHLDTVVGNIAKQAENQKTLKNKFTNARKEYLNTIVDARCYQHDELEKIRTELVAIQQDLSIDDPLYQEVERYVEPLRKILALLRTVDDLCHSLITSSTRKDFEAELKKASTTSQEIRNPGSVAHDWPGISGYPTYQFLQTCFSNELPATLDEVDAWLNKIKKLPTRCAELETLKQERQDLGEKITEQIEAINAYKDLPATVHKMILGACDRKLKQIKVSIEQIEPALKKCRSTRSRSRAMLIFVTLLATIMAAIWTVPTLEPVKASAIAIIMGTPTPTATPVPTVDIPTWTPVIITASPTPTPTPVPPQAGRVSLPGNVNVRQRPDLNLNGVGVIATEDRVVVTGFTNDSEGRRWYRIDVPDRGLGAVWVMSPIYLTWPEQRDYETLRLDGDIPLNDALFIPFEQAIN